jgi:predicted nucleotidyltransferase/predicted transcriptional regulator
MRIDPNGTIGGQPTLFVRKLMQRLRDRIDWDVGILEKVAELTPHEARALSTALEGEGLVERNRGKRGSTWSITQRGQSFGSATAARPITRKTAERTLAEFLKRVQQVNGNEYFLAKVTKVVLFGSFLRDGVDRLSDVDVAVQLEPKERNFELAQLQNERRVAELTSQGQHFVSFFERDWCWYRETFRFLKGRSRSISLADYKAEKAFVDKVPHQFLVGEADKNPAPVLPAKRRLPRRPRGCPF